MKVERLKEHPETMSDSVVTFKAAGNTREIRYMSVDADCKIRKLDKDLYVDVITGEVKEFQHNGLRVENLTSLSRSMRDLRDLINANTAKPQSCLWVTLTYRENMRDPEKLYEDYRKFNMRLAYFLNRHGLSRHEYICVAEPQGRGAWHIHAILVFQEKRPFISNEDMFNLWGHGFVSVKSLKGISNPGLYLSAYLCDMDIRDAFGVVDLGSKDFKEITITDEDGKRHKKSIVKGARLTLYPVGFRLYRCSRNVKRPIITQCTEAEALRMIGNAKLVYETTVQVSDDEKVVNTIYYRHYNKKPNRKRGNENGE